MKILKKVWTWIESFWSKLDREVDKLLPFAINVTQTIKKGVENNQVLSAIEIIKIATPDPVDAVIDKSVQWIQKNIPKIALQLEIIKSISEIQDVNEQMIAVVDALRDSSDEDWAKYWAEFSKQFLYAMADGKLTWGEAGALAEYHYRNYVKGK